MIVLIGLSSALESLSQGREKENGMQQYSILKYEFNYIALL